MKPEGSPMATQRHRVRQNPDGYWTVYDVFTGYPVEIDGVIKDRLMAEEADDLVDLLNLQDAKRRGLIKRSPWDET
jgi:hypothetical protein